MVYISMDIQELVCCVCGHKWIPRKRAVKLCPGCQSPKWDNNIASSTNDLIGQRFGSFVVLSKKSSNSNYKSRWLCRCDCGNEKVVLGSLLRNGIVRSCGCDSKRKSFWPSYEQGIMFNSYRSKARQRHIEFSLTKEEFLSLILSPCHYCMSVNVVGVGRRNNGIGYTLSNSVPCCHICKCAKNQITEEEFLEYISNIRTSSPQDMKDHAEK